MFKSFTMSLLLVLSLAAPLPVVAQSVAQGVQQMTPQQYQQYMLMLQQQQQQRNRRYNGRNLPPTTLDGFVSQAGGMAEMIYGDEGTDGLPPLNGFDKGSRINSGIMSPGLTTGHGSFMPDAWGGDEFTGNEWDMSGM